MNYNSFYANVAYKYNFSRLDEGKVFNSTLNYIVNHLEGKNLKILDIGCGTGEYGFALKQMGYDVCGIDKSSAQVEIASKKICASIGDVLCLNKKDNSVDVILMIMMLHQIDALDLEKALAQVVRVLKPGGVVIIKTCFKDDIKKRITSKYFPSCYEFDKIRFHSRERLSLANCNLEIKSCDKMSVLVPMSKEKLIQKFRAKGASNIGMLSDNELEEGISQILKDYEGKDTIEVNFDNTFLTLKCKKQK